MTDRAARLWLVTPTAASLEAVFALQDARPVGLEVVNDRELRALVERIEAADPEAGAARALPAAPMLQLATLAPNLTFDYLDIGYRLVSARLRETMALTPDEAQLLEVNASRCSPAIRAMGYCWLHLLHVADPFDREQSDGAFEDAYVGPPDAWRPDAPTVRRWRLRPPTPDRPVRVRWRADFVAPAPLFQAAGMPWTLATDELAGRIRAAGLEDVMLQDVTEEREAPPHIIMHQWAISTGADAIAARAGAAWQGTMDKGAQLANATGGSLGQLSDRPKQRRPAPAKNPEG